MPTLNPEAVLGTFLGNTIGLYIVLSIISYFTRRKLNPRFEELIEKRMESVTRLALLVVGVTIAAVAALAYAHARLAAPIRIGALVLLVTLWAVCGYRISRLKGNGEATSVFWAFLSLTWYGLLILLVCANYRPTGETPAFPVYRGRKLSFACKSCGHHVSDYECNAGTEGMCPKCGTAQLVPSRSIPRKSA
jgi:uncharacterized membrane protein (DUF485 family)